MIAEVLLQMEYLLDWKCSEGLGRKWPWVRDPTAANTTLSKQDYVDLSRYAIKRDMQYTIITGVVP